mmetsp:Transcript_24903/g.59144  ORF Transcript_24903/g.59144 Transcript_24903/m.59144 type:complete len:90 (-) Transcript_24903:255-524(-)
MPARSGFTESGPEPSECLEDLEPKVPTPNRASTPGPRFRCGLLASKLQEGLLGVAQSLGLGGCSAQSTVSCRRAPSLCGDEGLGRTVAP